MKWDMNGGNPTHLSKSPALVGFFVCGMMGRFVYMKNKILKASQWLRDRTLIEKAIIHIGLFPLPIIFLLLTYPMDSALKNK